MGRLLIAGLITVGVSVAQTKISLATQSKQVDFTGAASTRPFRAGTALPTSCSQGEVFHVTTAAPGTNLYSCSAANQWVPLSLPSVIGKAGTVLANNGSSIDWVPLAGDISGTPGAETVQGLQGVSVAPVLPSDGQSLVFNSGLNRWQPGSGSSVSSWPVTRSSNTILTVGTGPGIRIGDVYCQVPLNPATVTVGSGTGTIFLFIRSNCELVAASNIVVSSCVQCTSTTGTGYEPDSFPIADRKSTRLNSSHT